MRRRNITGRLARWSARHPWRAVGVWLVLVVLAVGAGSAMAMKTPTAVDQRVGQSGRAAAMLEAAGLQTPDTEYVLIGGSAGRADRHSAEGVAHVIATQVSGDHVVAGTQHPVWSTDGGTLMLPITLKERANGADPDVSGIQHVVTEAAHDHPGMKIAEAGTASLNAAVNDRVGSDLGSAESISLPITLLIMLVVFAALIAAGIPVLLALTSVLATMGLMGPISHLIPMESTVTSMILLIGMAVGVDYSLFYLKRERQERAKGATKLDAVEIATQTSGHSIVVSGSAVIACMAGLYAVGSVTFNSLAAGAILVVAIAVFGSLTVLPALLVIFGHWVDRPRVPLLWRLVARIRPGGASRVIFAPVLRHPKTAFLAALVVLVALAGPALGMKTQQGSLDTLPQNIPQVQTMQRISTQFPSAREGVQVVLTTTSDRAQAVAALGRVAAAARATGRWAEGRAGIRVGPDTAVLSLGSTAGAGSSTADSALNDLRDQLVPNAVRGVPDARWAVGGSMAEEYDVAQQLSGGLPKVLVIVLGLMLVMMALTFRSVVVAVLSTLLNLLSVGATFGVVSLVFEHTWAQGLLDFHSTGALISWIPIFLFVVLMGLSMDYHVFVLSRVREHVRRGLPPRVAVASALDETAGVVTSAAVVMVSVFALFATLSMVEMKEIGVGLSVAVLLDATLVRLVLLPSALVILGKVAWWPMRVRGDRPEPVADEARLQPVAALPQP
ncbi:MMPL family transporter [Leekyejoonella antrihumi]|uniref:MMPL family transporter n=1 Tax=Leekyejoonella antrihumi TaxID=1660198 RepID=A0A563DWI6_9MICO|nr:MMPL family transporter [Leekyejoonella antrihumi]TWP34577.1 MMPL family transporter [Leekyejoonella antrihumi]